MNNYWHSILGASVLLILLILPGIGWSEIVITTQGVQMSPPAVAQFHSMEARIVGPEEQVYHAISFGETLEWVCGDCSDGGYTVETRTAVVVGEEQTSKGMKPVLRVRKTESARFAVQEGVLTPMIDPRDVNQSRLEETAPFWQRLVAIIVMDWLIPAAYADFNVYDSNPDVIFNDSDFPFVPVGKFFFGCDAVPTGDDRDNVCRLLDDRLSRIIFKAQSTSNILRMGIGTSSPVEALHLATPQTPFILLDGPGTNTDFKIGGAQNIKFTLTSNSGIGGVTGDVMTLANDLDSNTYPGLGIWQQNPAVPLHVGSHDGMSARVVVENTQAPTASGDVRLFQLINPGNKIVRFSIVAGTSEWTFDNEPGFNAGSGVNSGRFRIGRVGTGVPRFTIDGFGNGNFFGTSTATNHINTSSREIKAGFAPVDSKAVLEKVVALPISTWHYRAETPSAQHLGPVAEDFYAAFGLSDERHISTVDASGVALAAIQGLYRTLEERNQALEQRNQALQQQLQAVQQELQTLRQQVMEKDR